MPRIAPRRPRATRTSVPGGIRFTIPARRNLFRTLFLCVWLVGWAFGEVTVARQLLHGEAPSPFLLVWLAAWTVGGAFALAGVAWGLGGREVITVASGAFTVRRAAFGLGRTSAYAPARVRNLRVAPVDPRAARAGAQGFGMGAGVIAFDYEGRTLRLGAGLDEAEAESIVLELRERLPSAA